MTCLRDLHNAPNSGIAFDQNRRTYGEVKRRLEERMLAAAQAASGYRGTWSDVETEHEVVRYLAMALAVMGDRSAVDELGISW